MTLIPPPQALGIIAAYLVGWLGALLLGVGIGRRR